MGGALQFPLLLAPPQVEPLFPAACGASPGLLPQLYSTVHACMGDAPKAPRLNVCGAVLRCFHHVEESLTCRAKRSLL